jgi:uncharacterized caspase-like protein
MRRGCDPADYRASEWACGPAGCTSAADPAATRVLANADRADVLAGLEWLEKDSEDSDVNILFLAGHGVTDDKGYFYYLAADALPSNLRATAVGRDEGPAHHQEP